MKKIVCKQCRKKVKVLGWKPKYCNQRCYWKSLIGKRLKILFPEKQGLWNKGRKFPERCGVKGMCNWKGEKAKYAAVHMWVRRVKGKPSKCKHCGASERKLHWANIDHKYKRNPDDFIPLCVPCHRRYDYHVLSI